MAYDAAGRCVESNGTDRHKERRFIYEPGNHTRYRWPGAETIYQYNPLGQVERRIDPNGAIHVTEPSEFPMRNSVPTDAAREAVKEFCTASALSPSIAWEED